MAVITKHQALEVIRRAYGPDTADSLAAQLPDRIDLEDAKDAELLFQLGLTRERLIDALGGSG